jgi:hypothetical protein
VVSQEHGEHPCSFPRDLRFLPFDRGTSFVSSFSFLAQVGSCFLGEALVPPVLVGFFAQLACGKDLNAGGFIS